jgi:acetyl-CoA acetyltransferase family protein
VDGKWRDVTVTTDEGPRADTTVEALGKLKPAFKATGSVTAGNSSQMSDGAAATLLASREVAEQLGLPILGKLLSYKVVGVPPEIMGVGPAYAIPAAVEAAGLSISDIGLFEINEAFASQALFSMRHLGLSGDNVNVNGGAIALGHPLGCTGAKLTASLLHEMKRRGVRYGVVSMCIGGGMGAAAVFEA